MFLVLSFAPPMDLGQWRMNRGTTKPFAEKESRIVPQFPNDSECRFIFMPVRVKNKHFEETLARRIFKKSRGLATTDLLFQETF